MAFSTRHFNSDLKLNLKTWIYKTYVNLITTALFCHNWAFKASLFGIYGLYKTNTGDAEDKLIAIHV